MADKEIASFASELGGLVTIYADTATGLVTKIGTPAGIVSLTGGGGGSSTLSGLTDLGTFDLATNSPSVAAVKATANAAIPAAQKGAASGVATLGAGSKIPAAQMTGVLATTDLTDVAAAITTPLAGKLSNALAWTGTVPALVSSTSPVAAFGSNAFVYTGAGGAVLDGQTYATGDLALWNQGGTGTFTKVPAGGAYLGIFANTGALPTASTNTAAFACVGASAPYAFWTSNGTAWVQELTTAQVGVTSGVAPNSDTVQITGNVTISVANANAATYNGKVLEFTGAFTVTLGVGLPTDFGFGAIPPSSGLATIASDGTTTLNGSITSVTRSPGSYTLFAVVQRSTNRNQYVVN